MSYYIRFRMAEQRAKRFHAAMWSAECAVIGWNVVSECCFVYFECSEYCI